MGEVHTDEINFFDIAGAIRKSNHKTTKYQPNQMAAAISQIPSAYNITNSVLIQAPASSGSIPANTFVQFDGEDVYSRIVTSSIRSSGAGTDQISGDLSTCELVPDSSGGYFLRTSTADSILTGPSTTVFSAGTGSSPAKIDDHNALVSRRYYDDGSTKIYACVVNVQNGVITPGAVAETSWGVDLAGNVPIVYSGGTSGAIYGMNGSSISKRGCTISGDTVTLAASTTTIKSSMYSGASVQYSKVGNDVLIFGTRLADSSTYLGMAFLESDPTNTITIGGTLSPSPITYLTSPQVIVIDDSSILLKASITTNTTETISPQKVMLAYLTINNGALTLQDEMWVDLSELTSQSIYAVPSSIFMDKDGKITLSVQISLGRFTTDAKIRAVCGVTVANNSISHSSFSLLRNLPSITNSTSTSVFSIAPGRAALSYSSNLALLEAVPLPTSVKLPDGRIDGVTIDDISQSVAGGISVLDE